MGAGAAWMVVGIVWWLVVGGFFRDHERDARAPFSARAWVGYVLYAVGTVPASHGLDLAQEQGGWSGAGLAALIAVAVVAAGFALLLVVVRAVRRRRAGMSR